LKITQLLFLKFHYILGRTRGTGGSTKPDEAHPAEMKMIRNYYEEEMEKIFNLVLPNVPKKEFCYKPEIHRFSWLAKTICTPK